MFRYPLRYVSLHPKIKRLQAAIHKKHLPRQIHVHIIVAPLDLEPLLFLFVTLLD